MLFEALEGRRLMSVSLNGTQLVLTGTIGHDTLKVTQQDSATLRVEDNGAVQFFADTSVASIKINGREGNDTLLVGVTVNENCFLYGEQGNDTLQSGAGSDILEGSIGADKLMASDGSDDLRGGDGNDQLFAGPGDDSLDGGLGADRLEGYTGTDVVKYSTRTVPLWLTLDGNANDGQANEADNILVDVENIEGGSASDFIVGNGANNRLDGNGGDDVIYGFGGNDLIYAGAGNDLVLANSGSDKVFASSGNDTVSGGEGNDELHGGDGNDVIMTGNGLDKAYGEAGNDFIQALDSNSVTSIDVIDGGSGFDYVERDGVDAAVNFEQILIG